jgi:hypothetical protein
MLVLLAGVLAFAGAAHAQDQVGPNLLQNPGFEQGHYNQDGIAEITVPNNWRMHWSNNELIFGGEWPTARPETVVWNASGGVPEGEEKFWKDGLYTMKVFKSWTPMWAAMSQDVSGLEVGRKYRLVVPIFVDIFEEYKGGQKVIPTRKDTGRVRLGASPVGATWRDEAAIAYSGWWTAETIDPFYQAFPTFVYDFVATQSDMTVWIEMASTYPYPNNGFFFDLPGLYALNETAPVAQPLPANPGSAAAPVAAVPAAPLATIAPPTPREDGSIVHTVQTGDTLWVIAIQYAEMMGKTPQDMLAYLQEINTLPTFINPGDEITIQPAGSAAPAEEAPAEDAAATPEAPADGAVADTTAPVEGEAPTGDAAAEVSTDGATTDETTAEAAPVELAAVPEAPPAEAIAGTICVAAFGDTNANGLREEGEGLVPNAAIAIARGGATVSTYITDGMSEPYCFTLSEPDSYQMTIYPPAGFAPTTESSWAVAVSNGESYTVSFGLQDVQAVAAVNPDAEAVRTADAVDAETPATGNALMDNLGFIVLGVAGVLVLMAIAGVVLLRRG